MLRIARWGGPGAWPGLRIEVDVEVVLWRRERARSGTARRASYAARAAGGASRSGRLRARYAHVELSIII